ncbi:hypothetical protein L227DRAFT_67083 [Lentinus tigrinus ALCF2SS1-6]|uniref:Uncharacterized protein n=1 Tax=Lentinus tigrinus ALCF2SS1-6 TaxID=1328759 RepID=A0A5C2SC81_9APHY|nr:hypothetical protein L227DRAFT_67083 [Lentinus tigrinus ALCF2SS1-6]
MKDPRYRSVSLGLLWCSELSQHMRVACKVLRQLALADGGAGSSLNVPPNASVEPQNHAVGMEPHLGSAQILGAVLKRSRGPATCDSAETRSPDPVSIWTPKMKTPYLTNPEATSTALAECRAYSRRQCPGVVVCRCCLPAKANRSHAAAGCSQTFIMQVCVAPREHQEGQDHQPVSSTFCVLEAASDFPSSIGQRLACLRAP